MKTKIISFDQQGIILIDEKFVNIYAIILGSLFIAILAQVSIPLPFSPVPITGQTIGVILVGGLLGAKLGVISVLCYLMEGAIGIPVFAQMKAGIHVLLGPTAGYLWGFVGAAFLMGCLAEKGFTKKPLTSFISCFAATTLILIIGTFYLAYFKVDLNQALIMGFYPFLVGDIFKSFLCTGLLISIRKI